MRREVCSPLTPAHGLNYTIKLFTVNSLSKEPYGAVRYLKFTGALSLGSGLGQEQAPRVGGVPHDTPKG